MTDKLADPHALACLQRQPPQGSPFFGIPPSVLGYICNMQLPQVMGATHIDQAPSAQASKDDAVESKEGTFAETLTKAEQLKVSTASMPPAQGFQDRFVELHEPSRQKSGGMIFQMRS
ncbi:unnamed protein product [Ostreobium quekettii]|uniref:Uncharacterized protein n=1 Tax=Ostreobium quekettii TaxID=121088 RepID=A0A8S1JFC8_9CHLO|nr:unnamed protein product [Ostreobium quekettii]|eukprot:evm.model.scf_610.2 EVM.evm.TU.scf_610.2   scf_610:12988-14225(-)